MIPSRADALAAAGLGGGGERAVDGAGREADILRRAFTVTLRGGRR